VWCIRGDAYAHTGDFKKALADFTEAIRVKSDDAEVYYLRGLVYRRLGQTAHADADFAQAKKLGYKGEKRISPIIGVQPKTG
jgi:Flp pilus assembly protein TadD